MENRILKEDGWQQRIRDKMGVDDAYLPDSVLEQPDMITIAEANVISMIPNYNTLTGDSKLYLETAVVLECCILLSPSMPIRLPKKQTGPHEGHELYINWDNKKNEFIEERNSFIEKIFELESQEIPYSTFPHFTITYPNRKWLI